MGCQPSSHARFVNAGNLTVSSWNINRGFIKKQTEIEHYLKIHNVDILALQETDLKYYNEKNPIVIPGFITYANLVIHTNEKTRLLVFVKANLKVTIRNDLMSSQFCSVWLEVQAKKNVLIGAFYREWDDGTKDKSISHQRENLRVFLNQIQSATNVVKKPVVIVGDMNIDMNKASSEHYPLKDLYKDLEECLAEQGIVNVDVGNTYTAFRTRTDGTIISSAIDHLYLSDLSILKQCSVLDIGLSDHCPVKAVLELKDFKEKQNAINKRSFKNFNEDAFNYDLALQQWEDLGKTTDVNVMTRMFSNFYLSALNKHAPYKKVIQRQKKRRFKLSHECLTLMKERDKVSKKIKNSSTLNPRDMETYKKLRNQVTKKARIEKKKCVAAEIEMNPSSANIWRIINNHISCPRSSTVKIEENGKEIETNQETAEIFNCHFKEKIQGLRDRINVNHAKDPLQHIEKKLLNKNKLSFTLKTVSETKVLKILNTIKSKHSCGFDDISSHLLKKSATVIYVPLTHLINTSITSGIFPDDWKLAIVKPLHKKGQKK